MNQLTTEVPQNEKLFYRIREVSQITGVKPHVLRYWETEFPWLRPAKGNNDQRRYRREDIDLILRIKKLLYEEGFTIAGACRRLQAEGNGRKRVGRRAGRVRSKARAPSRPSLGRIAQELNRVRSELVELKSLLGR